METKRTAAYCRTATADELAMRAQERRIREYANKHGHGELIFYRDCGRSGVTLDRPAMNALTADIKAGRIGTVITADNARIARNCALMSEWLDTLDGNGVRFATLSDGGTTGGLTYRPVGDYLLPNIAMSDPPDAPPLGLCGELHKRYLREYRPILYSQLLLSERLYPLCREIDEAARSRRRLGTGHDETVRELVYD
jgi:hypothetical protein